MTTEARPARTPGYWLYTNGIVWSEGKKDRGALPLNDADGYLIAAAPELYDALRECLRAGGGSLPFVGPGGSPNWAGDLRDALDLAADALRKAEGRE